MATKLKKLFINNSVLKLLSLLILSISLSILFEVCFNKYHVHSDKNITKNLLYISSALIFLSTITYILNRKPDINLINSSVRLINLTIYFEFLILFILFTYIVRGYVNIHCDYVYSHDLIIADTLFLWSIYISYLCIKSNNELFKERLLSRKLFEHFFSKSEKHTLIYKISLIFVLTASVQFIFIFLSMFFFYSAHTIYALTRSLYLFLFSLISYAFIYKKIEEKIDYVEYLERNIKSIENGDLKCELDVIGNDELASIANSINNISNGLDKALETQLKNERMKTELITNVSHDLKTPLTSIVSYIDILKNNELDDKTTKDYINILDKKAYRLKNLVEDIFEASKISSGDIEINLEKTDIKELLIQSVVELDDKIEHARLDFVINAPNEPIFTNIDGKRMFRVFSNLISNITKYSLRGTRVYIDAFIQDEFAVITMKNISNHKLNISPEELLERFVRGDVSRTTNGSGLGLSIASNLVDMQDGILDLDIDGDLFKVILKFKAIKTTELCEKIVEEVV